MAKRLGTLRPPDASRNFKGAEEPYPILARDRAPTLVRCLRSVGSVRDLLLHVRLSQAVRGGKIRGAGVLRHGGGFQNDPGDKPDHRLRALEVCWHQGLLGNLAE